MAVLKTDCQDDLQPQGKVFPSGARAFGDDEFIAVSAALTSGQSQASTVTTYEIYSQSPMIQLAVLKSTADALTTTVTVYTKVGTSYVENPNCIWTISTQTTGIVSEVLTCGQGWHRFAISAVTLAAGNATLYMRNI